MQNKVCSMLSVKHYLEILKPENKAKPIGQGTGWINYGKERNGGKKFLKTSIGLGLLYNSFCITPRSFELITL